MGKSFVVIFVLIVSSLMADENSRVISVDSVMKKNRRLQREVDSLTAYVEVLKKRELPLFPTRVYGTPYGLDRVFYEKWWTFYHFDPAPFDIGIDLSSRFKLENLRRRREYISNLPLVLKPIIYLYPEDTIDVTVTLDIIGGELTYTWPKYNDSTGWEVTAYPSGKLREKSSGRNFYSLFWEADMDVKPEKGSGFIVHRDSLNEFLESSLTELGLNYHERQEFILFWAPRMIVYESLYIYFSREEYAEVARLNISPKPHTLNRILMLWRASYLGETAEPQEWENPGRKGFTVVEWGGVKIN